MMVGAWPAWLAIVAVVAVVLTAPLLPLACWVWLGTHISFVKLRKRLRWGVIVWNISNRGLTSWAIRIFPFTYNVTNGKLTFDAPGPFYKVWNLRKRGRDHGQRRDDTSIHVEWSEPYHAQHQGVPLFDGLGKIMAQKARVNGVWIERRRKAGTATSKVLVGGGQEFPLSRLEDAVNAEIRRSVRPLLEDEKFVPFELEEA